MRKDAPVVIGQWFVICLIVGLTSRELMAQGSGPLSASGSAFSEASSATVVRPITTEIGTPFSTKYGYFEPASFNELPGWHDDTIGEAWPAFRQSCTVLQKKNAWEQPCIRSRHIDGSDEKTLRTFFEQEFIVYKIHNLNRIPAGVITGYYEPLLNGSRRYGGIYVHPVYAVPSDMLYLDSRTLRGRGSSEVRVRVEGRNVIVLPPLDAVTLDTYKLETEGLSPDIRTRKLRLRIDGERVVPYFSRQAIEQGHMSRTNVIAWVDNPAALYSMQIQGSGKVRLPDGEIIRVAYGEQNGHPFYPSLGALPQLVDSKGRRQVFATRGLAPALAQEDVQFAKGVDQEVEFSDANVNIAADASDRTRGLHKAPRQDPGIASNVDLVIEALLPSSHVKQAPSQNSQPITPRAEGVSPRNNKLLPHAWKSSQGLTPQVKEELSSSMPSTSSAQGATGNTDPSYVFFRLIPNDEGGPIGALGVPLTAGRSVAVDPRTTPLGFPVFISTQQSGRSLNRLMLAQDTGGAIRGAVRADYFWGFGEKAFQLASRMKEDGQMWLLMPKNQNVLTNAGGARLRGIDGAERDTEPAECVVADPELCVE
jgi:membrane-bound lytic murein transglycosylase A